MVKDHDSFDLAGGVLSVAVVAGGGGSERLAIQSAVSDAVQPGTMRALIVIATLRPTTQL